MDQDDSDVATLYLALLGWLEASDVTIVRNSVGGWIGLNHYTLFMQDYGGSVGFRIAAAAPEKDQAMIVQNANAYEGGLGPKWAGIAKY